MSVLHRGVEREHPGIHDGLVRIAQCAVRRQLVDHRRTWYVPSALRANGLDFNLDE
jgi:hypothetical protein